MSKTSNVYCRRLSVLITMSLQTCNVTQAWPPLLKYGGQDGQGQMQHFVNDDGFNTFRLPVGWQFLTGGSESGTLNAANFAEYNDLVQV